MTAGSIKWQMASAELPMARKLTGVTAGSPGDDDLAPRSHGDVPFDVEKAGIGAAV